MLTNSQIKKKGVKVLVDNLGDVDAEKFISILIREPFDYTKWQSLLWKDQSIEQISTKAMQHRKKNLKYKLPPWFSIF